MRIVSSIKRRIKKRLRHFKKAVPVYIPVVRSELLKDRVALITGGTSGIGLAIAKSFLQNGADVVITGRSKDRIERAKEQLLQDNTRENGVHGIIMDNRDVELFSEKLQEIQSCIGEKRISILVNNAGVNQGNKFGSLSEADYDSIMETNLKAAYFLSQAIADYMRINGIKGNILNIASSSSLRPAISPYTLSKWGIRGFTLGLAKTLIPYGIVVNGLAPGPTATPMLIKDAYDGIELPTNPAGRFATAEEIGNMAVILTSDMGRMVVGDIIYMTGGAGLITFDDMKYPVF